MPSHPEPLGMSRRARIEAWLWTGPVGHLLGVTLDFTLALTRYLLARRRTRRTG